MREFLYKSSFIRYLSAISCRPIQRNAYVANILTFYFLLFFFTFGTIFSFNLTSTICALIGAILFISSAQLGLMRNIKPNLVSLMPVSYKRRIVYDFLGAIAYTLIVLFIIGCIFFIGFIIGRIVSAVSGGVVPDEDDADIAFKFINNIDVYGGIFCAVYCLITYSAGIISSCFKKRRHRNIFLLCFVIALGLGVALSGIPYVMHLPESAGRLRLAMPFVSDCYKYMAAPWLCTLLWCIVAAGMLGTAIYLSYKYHKPKAF